VQVFPVLSGKKELFGARYPLDWYNVYAETIIHLGVGEEW